MWPMVCAASTITSTPRARAIATISFTGVTRPVRFERCVTSSSLRFAGAAFSCRSYSASTFSVVAGSGIEKVSTFAPRCCSSEAIACCISS